MIENLNIQRLQVKGFEKQAKVKFQLTVGSTTLNTNL